MWVTVWLIGLSYTKTFIRTGDMCMCMHMHMYMYMCVNEPELCRSILQTCRAAKFTVHS